MGLMINFSETKCMVAAISSKNIPEHLKIEDKRIEAVSKIILLWSPVNNKNSVKEEIIKGNDNSRQQRLGLKNNFTMKNQIIFL